MSDEELLKRYIISWAEECTYCTHCRHLGGGYTDCDHDEECNKGTKYKYFNLNRELLEKDLTKDW